MYVGKYCESVGNVSGYYVARQVGNGLGDYLVGRCTWMVST